MITRRLFLIGSAATVAAAAASAREIILDRGLDAEVVKPVASPVPWQRRKIDELMFGAKYPGGGVTVVSLCRSNGDRILSEAIGPGGCLRWIAMPGEEIICLPANPIVISVDRGDAEAIILIGRDLMPDGRVEHFCERAGRAGA